MTHARACQPGSSSPSTGRKWSGERGLSIDARKSAGDAAPRIRNPKRTAEASPIKGRDRPGPISRIQKRSRVGGRGSKGGTIEQHAGEPAQPFRLGVPGDSAGRWKAFAPRMAPREVERSRSVSVGIAKVSGLPSVGFDELVRFPGDLYGIAFNVDADEIGVVLLGGMRASTRGR